MDSSGDKEEANTGNRTIVLEETIDVETTDQSELSLMTDQATRSTVPRSPEEMVAANGLIELSTTMYDGKITPPSGGQLKVRLTVPSDGSMTAAAAGPEPGYSGEPRKKRPRMKEGGGSPELRSRSILKPTLTVLTPEMINKRAQIMVRRLRSAPGKVVTCFIRGTETILSLSPIKKRKCEDDIPPQTCAQEFLNSTPLDDTRMTDEEVRSFLGNAMNHSTVYLSDSSDETGEDSIVVIRTPEDIERLLESSKEDDTI